MCFIPHKHVNEYMQNEDAESTKLPTVIMSADCAESIVFHAASLAKDIAF